MIRKNLSILILNYNSIDLVQTFFKENYSDDPTITWCLVDNGSNDIVVDFLISYATEKGWNIWNLNEVGPLRGQWLEIHKGKNNSSVQLLLLQENYGYARGNNFGLDFIDTYIHPDYVMIANTDIVWGEGVVNHLLEGFSQDPRLAVIAPRVVGPDGDEQNPQFLPEKTKILQSWFRWFYPFSTVFYRLFSKRYDYRRSLEDFKSSSGLLYLDTEIHCFIGCCFIIDFGVFKNIGFFDSDTFLGTEEPRLVHRLEEKGFRIAIDLDVSIIHDQGSTTRASFSSRKTMQYFEESDYTYLRDYCGYGWFKLLFIKGAARYYEKFWMKIRYLLNIG
ncbi:MAG: glycosyltransferase [Methanomicrobiales archaeon]